MIKYVLLIRSRIGERWLGDFCPSNGTKKIQDGDGIASDTLLYKESRIGFDAYIFVFESELL